MSKYESVRERVMDMVEELTVGDALPPERELSAGLGVSRMTLRRALDELVREGHLIRRQGSGTFVAEPKISQPLSVTSFSEDMRRRGLTPGSRTLSAEEVYAGAALGRRLRLSPEALVLRVARLRLADDEPMAIEILHVPRALVPDLSEEDLAAGSFYEVLYDRYGLEIGAGVQTIEPTVTNEEESELLQVPLHSPAFLFERTTAAATGVVVEFVRSVYRGDRYRLTAELEPPVISRPRPTGDGLVEA